jgi:hypothetical protein
MNDVGLAIDGDEAVEAAGPAPMAAPIGLVSAHDEECCHGAGRDGAVSHSPYAHASMMASSSMGGWCSVTSVQRGFPSSAKDSCT